MQCKVSEAIDSDTLSCADFSVLVENIPRNATDKDEWLAFFNSLAPITDHKGRIASLAIALNNGKLLALSEERTKMEEELEVLRAQLAKTKYEEWQKKVKKAEKALHAMRVKMGKMRARTDFKAVALFVTFESEATRQEMQDEFKGLFPHKGTLFRNRHRLRVRRAPEPDVILWENLENRGFAALVRDSAVLVMSTFILMGSFGLILVLTSAKDLLDTGAFPSYCADAPDPNQPNAQEAITWLKYSAGIEQYRRMLKCYCDDCTIGCGGKKDTEGTFCAEWHQNERDFIILSLISAVAPAVINQVLKTALKVIVKFEKKHTTNERDSSLAANIFYAQFMNTGMIPLILNMEVPYYIPSLRYLGRNGLKVLGGKFRDFSSQWYMGVGTAMIPAVLTACVSPNVAHLAKWPTQIAQMTMAKTASMTQTQLNNAFQGPEVELSERYAAMLNGIFVILMYSWGMPLLYCFGVVYFVSAYWADKITMLEIFKRPGSIDSTLVRAAAGKFQWAVYVHLAFAAWGFGYLHGYADYVPLITYWKTLGQDRKRPGEDMNWQLFLTLVAEKLTKLQAFVPFALLLAIAARDVLNAFLAPAWRFLRGWWQRRKRRIEREKWIEARKKAGFDTDEIEADDDGSDDGGAGSEPRPGHMFSYSEALEYQELRGIESYDVLKNPRYKAAYEDREYVPADESESDLSEGSFGDDLDDDKDTGVATEA